MKAFFEYIKTRINSQVPAIKTVRMWNNQFLHSNEAYDRESDRKERKTTSRTGFRNEKAFPYPACFVEFVVESSNNLALGIKDHIMIVRFRFGVEAYKFERLDTFDFCDTFDQAIQLMAPTAASGLTFTTFQELMTEFDEDFNNVEAPYKDYRTRYRSSVTYSRRNDVTSGPVVPAIDGEIITSI